jgi:hypothetical protein
MKNQDYRYLLKIYADIWNKIFLMIEDLDMDKPLTDEVLSDPNHKFVKTMLYIYSMQSFVFKELN